MWLLLLVIFAGPMEIKEMVILEHLPTRQKCVARVSEATEIGLPPDASIGCLEVKYLTKIYGG